SFPIGVPSSHFWSVWRELAALHLSLGFEDRSQQLRVPGSPSWWECWKAPTRDSASPQHSAPRRFRSRLATTRYISRRERRYPLNTSVGHMDGTCSPLYT